MALAAQKAAVSEAVLVKIRCMQMADGLGFAGDLILTTGRLVFHPLDQARRHGAVPAHIAIDDVTGSRVNADALTLEIDVGGIIHYFSGPSIYKMQAELQALLAGESSKRASSRPRWSASFLGRSREHEGSLSLTSDSMSFEINTGRGRVSLPLAKMSCLSCGGGPRGLAIVAGGRTARFEIDNPSAVMWSIARGILQMTSVVEVLPPHARAVAGLDTIMLWSPAIRIDNESLLSVGWVVLSTRKVYFAPFEGEPDVIPWATLEGRELDATPGELRLKDGLHSLRILPSSGDEFIKQFDDVWAERSTPRARSRMHDSSPANRRRTYRAPAFNASDLSAKILGDNRGCKVVDVSLEGCALELPSPGEMAVETDSPMQNGDVTRLQLNFGDGHFVVHGKIVHVRYDERRHRWRYGVRLLPQEPGAAKALRELVMERQRRELVKARLRPL